MNRFVHNTDDEINQFIANQRNKNTNRKTLADVGLFQSFIREEEGSEKEIEFLPRNELNELLAKFIISVRRIDGAEFEPSSLRNIISSIDRYLKEHHYGSSIADGPEFEKARQALRSKQKHLKSQGKGSKTNAANPLTDAHIEELWVNGQLGDSSPSSIINTMWLYSTMGFGLRGSQEHRSMCWGDVSLQTDHEGHEYLSFNERQTKTRQGDTTDTRKIQPKLWANVKNKQRCPIEVYKTYCVKRPGSFSNQDDPFYIATSTHFIGSATERWFIRQPIGQNKLNNIMKNMARTLSGSAIRLTNHSARKTMLQKFVDKDVAPTDIMQISGHKNVQSVYNYSKLNVDNHKRVSTLIYENEDGDGPTRAKKRQTVSHTVGLTSVLTASQSRCVETEEEENQERLNDNMERPTFDLGFDFSGGENSRPNFSGLFTGNLSNCTINITFNPK